MRLGKPAGKISPYRDMALSPVVYNIVLLLRGSPASYEVSKLRLGVYHPQPISQLPVPRTPIMDAYCTPLAVGVTKLAVACTSNTDSELFSPSSVKILSYGVFKLY